MPEKYPQKPYDHETGSQLTDICKCGHMDIDHERTDSTNIRKECRQCICPSYEFEQQMTIEDAVDLAIYLHNPSWPEIKKILQDNDFDPVKGNHHD